MVESGMSYAVQIKQMNRPQNSNISSFIRDIQNRLMNEINSVNLWTMNIKFTLRKVLNGEE